MKQIKAYMPIYTGDVSGVASALYEYGGLVVMHDASGCNSTYNTHDELRWYEKPSSIFISGMTEVDAVTGNEERLISDIAKEVTHLKPEFIALAATPIPFLNGMDLHFTAKKIEQVTGIPSFFVPTNGAHSYVKGAGGAFLELVKKMLAQEEEKQASQNCNQNTAEVSYQNQNCNQNTAEVSYQNQCNNQNKMQDIDCNPNQAQDFDKNHENKTQKLRVNILGLLPFEFALSGYETSVEQWIIKQGMTVNASFGMGEFATLDNVKKANQADVNLVVSSSGMALARYLWETYSIPYVLGAPVGVFEKKVEIALKKAAETHTNQVAYARNNRDDLVTEDATMNQAPTESTSASAAISSPAESTSASAAISSPTEPTSASTAISSPTEPTSASAAISSPTEYKSTKTAYPTFLIAGDGIIASSIAAMIAMEQPSFTRDFTVRCLSTVETEPEIIESGVILADEEDVLEDACQKAMVVVGDPLLEPMCGEHTWFIRLPQVACSGRIFAKEMPNLFEVSSKYLLLE